MLLHSYEDLMIQFSSSCFLNEIRAQARSRKKNSAPLVVVGWEFHHRFREFMNFKVIPIKHGNCCVIII